jgi:outer membrane murein-binding lipoprotein Lpp
MTTKLFERLVTKFSIKVNDLAKYLEISKATIYNYRNSDNFSDIPSDKQYKIFYLFGKETEEELKLVLDESDNDMLTKYVSRISSILKGSIQDKKDSISSIESLNMEIEQLSQDNLALRRQLLALQKFDGLDEFTRTVILDKVAKIVEGAKTAEIRQFLEYLEIFESYKKNNK